MSKSYHAKITNSELKRMSKPRQKEIMEGWFRSRYEDPVHRTPYDEGSYVYIHGGPFDAREELEEEFGEAVEEALIEELVDELQEETTDWTRTSEYEQELYPEDFYEVDAALSREKPIEGLLKNLELLRSLLKEKDAMDAALQGFQLIMIYSFCITSLESFLSDTFARKVLNDQQYKEKYLKAEASLAQQRFSLSELYQKGAEIDKIIKTKIADTSFHSLEKVHGLYQGVFAVDIGDVGELIKAVHKRHDFIHRGGKTIDGEDVTTTKSEVEGLIVKIEAFCRAVSKKVPLNPFDNLVL